MQQMFSYRTMKTNGFKVISCFIISTKLKYFLPGNLSLDNVWLMSRKLGKNYVLEIAGLIQNILKRTIPLLQNPSPKLKCFLKKSFLIQVDLFLKKKKSRYRECLTRVRRDKVFAWHCPRLFAEEISKFPWTKTMLERKLAKGTLEA